VAVDQRDAEDVPRPQAGCLVHFVIEAGIVASVINNEGGLILEAPAGHPIRVGHPDLVPPYA
jgi:hypothetical protein